MYNPCAQVCQTIVNPMDGSKIAKGCYSRSQCGPSFAQNQGKCVYCCSGPDCDKDPAATSGATCGGNYTTLNDTHSRRKRDAGAVDQPHDQTCGELRRSMLHF